MSVMQESKPSGNTRRRFTKELKADSVALVLDRTVGCVGRPICGYGEDESGDWVRQARIDRGDKPGLTTGERAELVRLRRENAQLRVERDLLKRARAFWVKMNLPGMFL